MAKTGRKGFGEELELLRRYTALTEPFFKVLTEMLNSEEKADKKWAAEQLGKAYVKMIPQDVTSGGQPLNIQFDGLFKTTYKASADNTVAGSL